MPDRLVQRIDDLDTHFQREIFGVPILFVRLLEVDALDAGGVDDAVGALVGAQHHIRLGERLRSKRQESFGDIAVHEQLLRRIANPDTLGFRVKDDRNGLVGISGTVNVDVDVAGAGFNDRNFGVAYHGLDEAGPATRDEHVDMAARLHHRGSALAAVGVDRGN